MDRRFELGRRRAMASRTHALGCSLAITFSLPGIGGRRAEGARAGVTAHVSFAAAAPAFLQAERVLLGGHMISLAGKAAVVTGGSRGIGAATVKIFAQAGADVVFSYHKNRDAAAQVVQEARKHGTRIESCKADLGKMPDAKKLIDFAHQQLGRLDILVAN